MTEAEPSREGFDRLETPPSIEVSRERGQYQLAIFDGDGLGYRLAGPKFGGNSVALKVHPLTRRDADQIRAILDSSFPPAVDTEPSMRDHLYAIGYTDDDFASVRAGSDARLGPLIRAMDEAIGEAEAER